MPDPVALYSSIAFDAQELTTFVRSLHIEGAKILINEKPRRGHPDNAQVIRGTDQYVYISHSNYMLAEGYIEKEDLERVKRFLGSEPKTCVLLDISKYDPRSQLLGLEIASMLLDHWPGIIDVLREVEYRYLRRKDVLDLYEKDYSFLGCSLFPPSKVSKLLPIIEQLEEDIEIGQVEQDRQDAEQDYTERQRQIG
jgi:hypothetical protein